MRLKSKASLVMALTVTLALVVTGGVSHLFLEQSLHASINSGLEGVADNATDSLHRFVAGSMRDARAVAAALPPEVVSGRDVDAAEAHLARMQGIFSQFDNGLFLLDAQGRLWADYPNAGGVRGKSFAFREYYQRTVETGQGVVGRPYESVRSKEPVCTFTAPLFDGEGKLSGMVGCSVKLLSRQALGMLRGQAIGETGYLYIFDQTRLMIMHPQVERILRRDIPQGANLLLDEALKGFEGVGETVNSRGVPMLAVFKRVPLTDWILAAQQPKAEALAPLNRMQSRLLMGVLAGALLAVLVGLWVVRSLTKPISDLNRATADLGREPLPPGAPALARGDEIGELARSFRDISLELQQIFAELRRTERRLNTAQSVAHIGSWELDLATGEMWGSAEAASIYGVAGETSERLPWDVIRRIPLEEDRPRLGRAMEDLLAGRGDYAVEFRIRRADDSEIRDVFSRATLIPGQNGGPGKVVGTIQDITERQRAEAEIRRKAEELTALNALGRDLNRDLSLAHTVRAALGGLMESVRPDMAFLFLRQGERLVLQDAAPAEAKPMLAAAGDHRVGECICGLAARERRSLFSLDILSDHRCTWTECKAAGVKSFAAIPLFGADEVMGVIGLASHDRRDFQGQADFLETLAGQVAVAATNARLFEEAQEELSQRQRTLKALGESQDRYRALSDQSPLGISLIHAGGRYEYINPAFIEMFGYTLEDIPTRNDWFRLAYPDEEYRREISLEWDKDVAGCGPGQVSSRTLDITTKGGVLKSILLRVVTLPSGDHFIIYEDITERLRAEESLRRSEERFRRFAEGSPVAMAITNAEQGMDYFNPKFTQTFGYDLADIPDLEHWWAKAYPDPEYRREVMEAWLENVEVAHRSDAEVAPVERRVRCKDGSDKMVAFHGAPVGDKTIVILLDVTAEREAGRALMESEAKFRRFVEATPMGIHTYRRQAGGRLEFSGYNQAADRILGVEHGLLLGKSVEEAFPALADTEIPAAYIRAADQGTVWRDEKVSYEHGRVSGAYEVMAFQTTPGNVAVMFNDITLRLRDQEELRILEQQLVRSQKLEALGTLASGIAHDFNNILQALNGRVQLLADDETLPEPTRRHVENMRRSLLRATNLVARMLSFSRSGDSKLTVLDLNREVLSAVEMLAHALPRMMEIRTELDQDAGLIMGEANRLEQVLLNLATNARDAMPEGGYLLFRTRRRTVTEEAGAGLPLGDYVVLEVSDNGQGMDAKTLGRIFEPFFSTKETGKGTGLGLYSVFGIMREHQGTITCQSRPGHGTTFTMLFPRATARPDALEAVPGRSALNQGAGETILLVDDEPEVLEPLAEALTGQGYLVQRAGSGEEALAILEMPGAAIDIILMDINMPGMGGERALAEIKAAHPRTRVVIASGYQDRTLKERLLREGADHFIGKPFDFKELLACLREVLRRRTSAPADQGSRAG